MPVTKNILITRNPEQAKDLAEFLQKKNFRVFSEPLFVVKKIPVKKISQKKSVIITSANACEYLISSGLSKDTKIFAVGKKTAESLIRSGFGNVKIAEKRSAISLKKLIESDLKIDPKQQFFYFHGERITLDFAQKFKNVEKILAYKTEKSDQFSPDFMRFLARNGDIDYVLFFSSQAVENFFDLVEKANIGKSFSGSEVICFSEKIATKFQKTRGDFGCKFDFGPTKTFAKTPFLKDFYD
jgi:uroporphyrinogen-III synthase